MSPVPADPCPLDPRLLQALQGIDLTSADGRAGLRTLLAEIARLSPDAVLQQAAGIDLRRAGWPNASSETGTAGEPLRKLGRQLQGR